jgi:hypothetical protein
MELGETSRQSHTILSERDHIVQYVQKTYEHGQDIAASLRDLTKKDLSSLSPERGQSSLAEAAAKVTQQAGMDIPGYPERQDVSKPSRKGI